MAHRHSLIPATNQWIKNNTQITRNPNEPIRFNRVHILAKSFRSSFPTSIVVNQPKFTPNLTGSKKTHWRRFKFAEILMVQRLVWCTAIQYRPLRSQLSHEKVQVEQLLCTTFAYKQFKSSRHERYSSFGIVPFDPKRCKSVCWGVLLGYVCYTSKICGERCGCWLSLVMLDTCWQCMFNLACFFVCAIRSKAWKVQLLLPINGVLIAQRLHVL